MSETSPRIIVTNELTECPQCDAPAVKYGDRQRGCNSCGLVWERMSEQDELDLEAERTVRTRSWAEENGRGKSIGKGARW